MISRQRFFQTSMFAMCALLQIQPSVKGVDDEPTISVSATAELNELADQVVIETSMVSIGDTVEAAVEQNNKKVERISEFLKKSGLEAKHFKMGVLSIGAAPQPGNYVNAEMVQQQMSKPKAAQHDSSLDDPFAPDPVPTPPRAVRQQPKVKASRELIVTLTPLKQFEPIYVGLMKIDSFPSHTVRFQSSKINELRDEVRRKAIIAAKDKANLMAGALGVTLASVKTIVEKSSSHSYGGAYEDPFGSSVGEDFESVSDHSPLKIRASSTVNAVFVLSNTTIKK